MIKSSPLRSGLVALGLVITSGLGALGWFWWSAAHRPDLPFLPRVGSAEWIVYPTPPQTMVHPRLRMSTVFRRSFFLENAPEQALLQAAGLREYSLSLNGIPVRPSNPAGKNWKKPDQFAVAKQLRIGSNEMAVTVFNTDGPPALWLQFDAARASLSSGTSWEASYAGADWRVAGLAKSPKLPIPGGLTYGGKEPWLSFKERWPTLALFLILAAFGYWGLARAQPKSQPILVAGLALLWVVLFANNLGPLPDLFGYDVDGHLDYIRYVQQRHAFPLASDGWEMYQPPLYYLLCAGLLQMLSLTVDQSAGIAALRLLGLGIGVAHFTLVWASLRLLFPGEGAKQRTGLLLAAFSPPLLYICQYVTNETLCAALATACVYLVLRILKTAQLSWRPFMALGLCLGAALLTKPTMLILLPVVFGSLVWRAVANGRLGDASSRSSLGTRLGGIGLTFGVCMVVSGWHYARVWHHFGSPLVGAWDPRSGFSFWQDEGYRTGSFYLHFGSALVQPWFSSMRSFGDGIYSTLWGDGLLGGTGAIQYCPPWNYDLMAIGYWLALLPSLLILAGGVLATIEFIRRPSAEWFLLLGLSFLTTVVLAQFSLAVPYYATVKAFYGLCALVPFCACGALGWQALSRRSATLRVFVCVGLGMWAVNSFASFWISHSSAATVLARARYLLDESQYADAAELLKSRFESMGLSAEARSLLASILAAGGDNLEATKQADTVLRDNPDYGAAHLALMSALEHQQRAREAAVHGFRALELLPGFPPAYEELAGLLVKEGRYEEAMRVARQGIGVAPFSAGLHFALGSGLLVSAQEVEGREQLELAFKIKPNWPEAHSSLGALLAARGRLEAAVAEYSETLRLQTTNEHVRVVLGTILAMQGKLAEAANHLAEALRLNPQNPRSHSQLALIRNAQRQTAQAIDHYSEAVRLDPSFFDALNNLAWIRAANPNPEFRNGSEAVRLAERACEGTGYKQATMVGTLAAAYAEAGRFEEAITTAGKARELALAAGQNEIAEKNQELIRLFRAHQPYRETN